MNNLTGVMALTVIKLFITLLAITNIFILFAITIDLNVTTLIMSFHVKSLAMFLHAINVSLVAIIVSDLTFHYINIYDTGLLWLDNF